MQLKYSLMRTINYNAANSRYGSYHSLGLTLILRHQLGIVPNGGCHGVLAVTTDSADYPMLVRLAKPFKSPLV